MNNQNQVDAEERQRLLTEAEDKITVELLDSMQWGETKRLNELFVLFHYHDDDVIVLAFSSGTTFYEICQVMYSKKQDDFVLEYID